MRFTVGEYVLRKATHEDEALAAAWIEGDPYHKGRVLPAYFIQEMPGEECWVFEDATGPVFFFKTQQAVRLHIQFGPSTTRKDRTRNARGLEEGMRWLDEMLHVRGYREMVSNIDNPVLENFAMNRLGFKMKTWTVSKVVDGAPRYQTPGTGSLCEETNTESEA